MITLKRDETRVITVFADREPDPHRVAFWRIVVSADGLTLQPEHEPDSEALRSSASWHDLHDMMHVRQTLLDELTELRRDIRSAVAERDRLLVRARTLRRIVEAKQSATGETGILHIRQKLAVVSGD